MLHTTIASALYSNFERRPSDEVITSDIKWVIDNLFLVMYQRKCGGVSV